MFYVPQPGEVLKSQPPSERARLLPSVIDSIKSITTDVPYMQMYNHLPGYEEDDRELFRILNDNPVFYQVAGEMHNASGDFYCGTQIRFGKFGGAGYKDLVSPRVLEPHVDSFSVDLGNEIINLPGSVYVVAIGAPTMWADCDFTYFGPERKTTVVELRDTTPMEEGVIYEFGPLSAHFQPEAPKVAEMRYAWQMHPAEDADALFRAMGLVE